MIDRYPALIARCTGAADVIAAVNFARDHGLPLSVRGGGHNVAGNAICDGGLVIDLSPMRGVHVDPRARVAHVQGGATWADVDRETQVFGLATPGGVVSTTGVAGLTLHGGMGYLRGKHGLSIDNLRAVDIVTADGALRHASAEENADLFWAVRGAGSNFGVVTSFEFQLHPVGPTVMLCAAFYALEDAPAVLRKWREFTATAPDAFSSIAAFMTLPDGLGFPPELVGRPIAGIAGAFIGPVEEGERVIRPLRELAPPLLDMSGPMPYTALQGGFDAFFPAGGRRYWKAAFVDELGDDAIDALGRIAAARPDAGAMVEIWSLAGAVARVGAGETAFGARPPFMVSFEANWADAAEDGPQPRLGARRVGIHATVRVQRRLPELPRLRRGEGGDGAGGVRRELPASAGAEGPVRPDQPLPHEHQHPPGQLRRGETIPRNDADPRRSGGADRASQAEWRDERSDGMYRRMITIPAADLAARERYVLCDECAAACDPLAGVRATEWSVDPATGSVRGVMRWDLYEAIAMVNNEGESHGRGTGAGGRLQQPGCGAVPRRLHPRRRDRGRRGQRVHAGPRRDTRAVRRALRPEPRPPRGGRQPHPGGRLCCR